MLEVRKAVLADREWIAERMAEWKPRAISRHALRKVDNYLIAESNGRPLGFLEGHHDFGNWGILARFEHLDETTTGSYVIFIYVVPEGRGRGVGSELLRIFTEAAQQAGSVAVVTWPDEEETERDIRVAFFKNSGLEWLDPGRDYRSQDPWLMGLVLDALPAS